MDHRSSVTGELRKKERKKTHLKKTSLQKKAKRDKKQQHAASSKKPLHKSKADTNDGTPKEKVGKRKRTRQTRRQNFYESPQQNSL